MNLYDSYVKLGIRSGVLALAAQAARQALPNVRRDKAKALAITTRIENNSLIALSKTADAKAKYDKRRMILTTLGWRLVTLAIFL